MGVGVGDAEARNPGNWLGERDDPVLARSPPPQPRYDRVRLSDIMRRTGRRPRA